MLWETWKPLAGKLLGSRRLACQGPGGTCVGPLELRSRLQWIWCIVFE